MTQEADTQPENPLVGVKVVVNILEEGVLIGITRGAVDPHVENLAILPSDGLPAIMAAVPEVLERAIPRWEGTPRFPAYKAPAATTPARRTGRAATGTQQGTAPPQEGVERPRLF